MADQKESNSVNDLINNISNINISDSQKQNIKLEQKPEINIDDLSNLVENINITYDKDIDKDKKEIIDKFIKDVKNKQIDTSKSNKKHDGAEGHWLEKQMGLKPNGKNEPDMNGYEMKKENNKITFGDYAASEYIFTEKKPTIIQKNKWENTSVKMTINEFIKIFGTCKEAKNRYSWSGSCVPTYDTWNDCGQKLIVNENNDICIYYSYSKDKREVKNTFPEYLKHDDILIVIWLKEKLSKNINNKFNKKGFFICKKNSKNTCFNEICFGPPLCYELFIDNIKKKNIIFDSGMVTGNSRKYSHFRGSGKFWNSLITEKY